MDMSQFVRLASTGGSQFLSTEPLLYQIRQLFTDMLQEHGFPLDLKVGECVYPRLSPEMGPFLISKDLGDLGKPLKA